MLSHLQICIQTVDEAEGDQLQEHITEHLVEYKVVSASSA